LKCEDFQNLIIEELYDEIAPEDHLRLREHLRTCPECAGKMKTLRTTSHTLQKWPDREPHLNLTFIPENRLPIRDRVRRFSFRKFAYGFAGACAALLLILAAGNTRISYKNGDFEFHTSLMPRNAISQPDNYLTKADLEQYQKENLAAVSQLINENNDREKVRQTILLSDIYKDFESKRQADLQVVSQALQQVNYGSEQRFNQTDRAINALIQYVNYQNAVKP